MFEKYGRAISDKKTREKLKKVWIAKKIVMLASLVLIFISSLLILKIDENEPIILERDLPILLTFLAGFAAFIASAVMHCYFIMSYKRILSGKIKSDESEAVKRYRKEAAKEEKSRTIPIIIMILLSAAGVILIVVETLQYPEITFGDMSIIGTILICIGVLEYVLFTIFRTIQRSQAGTAFEQKVGDSVLKIDAEQSNKPKVQPQYDVALTDIKYIFPNQNLRDKMTAVKKRYSKHLITGITMGIAIPLIADVILFSGITGTRILTCVGWIYPVFIAFCVIATYAFIGKDLYDSSKIEKEQYEELKANPKLAENLAIYELQLKFAKTWGKSSLIGLVSGFILSVLLAIFFPFGFWSVTGIVLVLIGLIIQSQALKPLSVKIRPHRLAIDDAEESKRKTEDNGVRDNFNQDVERIDDEKTDDVQKGEKIDNENNERNDGEEKNEEK